MAVVRRGELWRPTARVCWRCVAGAGVALALGSAGWAAAPTWTVTPTPGPGALMSVSCTSASTCTAVGVIGNLAAGTGNVLAERWNGQRWSIQPTPLPAGPERVLEDVSCTSVRFCAATGLVFRASVRSRDGGTLVGTWNGSRWTFTLHAGDGTPGAVSCTSRWFCVLTGGPQPLAWDGSRWRMMPVARKGWDFTGPVSCVSAIACVAIAYNVSDGSAPGAGATSERWNGRTWSVLAPINGTIYEPQAVRGAALSCAAVRACVAVLPTYNAAWVILSWHGRSWRDAPDSLYQDLTAGWGSTPFGVSCGSPTVCTIVGNSFGGGLIVRLAGGSAQLQPAAPTPDHTASVDLNGVSCTHGMCMAVGDYPDPVGASQTLAEQYG